jgi:MFS transporter, NNP family, nitrate/nitrite transporter
MALGFIRSLYVSPEINPINRKAKSIPVLNPFDRYGRTFFFAWFGFMVAFMSWYAFPPLVSGLVNLNILLDNKHVLTATLYR